jgi:biotin carboxylase
LQQRRILIVSTTTGYQTRSFGEAADRLGVRLVFATDRCHQLDDPWRDAAVPIRFYDEEASLEAIVEAARSNPLHGVIAVGDRPTRIAALAAEALGLPGNQPSAAEISRNKLATRERLSSSGLPTPWFRAISLDIEPGALARELSFPAVVKPLALSGSRGVIRANNPTEFVAAFERLRRLLSEKSVRAMRDAVNDIVIVEGFVPGQEFALEGLMEQGRLRPLALFDKPDPLDGPFFEETIYVTPSSLPVTRQQEIQDAVGRAVAAIGLQHGPVHAECRVNGRDVVVLEVAARPIGGLCAKALRFQNGQGELMSLEELLLRHALGEPTDHLARESSASGVMMVPIPRPGIYRRVEGTDAAAAVPGIEDVRITAKPDQVLVPLPEGASYLGFIFARRETSDEVVCALRSAHGKLKFVIEREVRLSGQAGMRNEE